MTMNRVGAYTDLISADADTMYQELTQRWTLVSFSSPNATDGTDTRIQFNPPTTHIRRVNSRCLDTYDDAQVATDSHVIVPIKPHAN